MKVDHVVYFTQKTPLEVVWEQRQLGWHAVMGGSHEQWGTYNALMYVHNAYIEWLALEHEKIANASDNPLIQLYMYDRADVEGWGTICFSVEQIEAVHNRLKKQGYPTSGILHAERKTTSGAIRRWKMLFIDQKPSDALPYPFFIEWEIEEKERLEILRTEGTILQENEQLEVTSCLFNVRDVEQTTEEWQVILGLESTKDTENTMIKLPNCTLKFTEKIKEVKERLIDVSIVYRE